ncbi:MAG: hypothetical protein M3276_05640 [Actinomycetota bacterium]|nr:hypothetical protein [Actinomycetota bacterium]
MSSEPVAPVPAAVAPEEVRERREHVLAVLRKHGMGNVRLFRRGRAAGLLVDLDEDRDGFDLVAAEQALEQVLGGHADVVSAGALGNPWRHDDLADHEAL